MINLTNGMLLYHGSYAEVPNIELEKCKTGKDFGRGFYVTSSYSQAQRFIPNSILRQKKVSHTSQRSNCGFVSVYRFDMGGSLKIHCFHNADREWLHFAAANRKKELFPDLIALFSEFDIIGGKIANDRTAQTLLLYIGGAYALAQIQMICGHPASKGSKIRVMPDVHPGKVGTIGLTMTVAGSILPNLVGIDIGCGIILARIKQKKVEFQKLNTVIRENIPAGFGIRKKIHRFYENFDTTRLYCHRHLNQDRTARSLGTLGGGNHFIELDKDSSGSLYAAVHSGSRHLGKEVTEYYLQQGQKALKEQGIQVPYELTVLDGALKEAYLHDQQIVQEYAALNRAAILNEMIKGMKWKVQETISCSHNYIEMNSKETSFAGGILRKGAVSAKKGEPVIIPVNMRDGILLGTGKGNEDWNYSAPHGSGRILRRDMVKEKYTVSDFKNEMKGIYCPCIGKETLDEAPFAYRGMEKIMEAIGDAAEITQVLKPVYSFKAGN